MADERGRPRQAAARPRRTAKPSQPSQPSQGPRTKSQQAAVDDEIRASVAALARAARQHEGDLRFMFLEQMPLTDEELSRQDKSQDIKLKRVYAYGLLATLLAQLVVADIVFIWYANFGKDWKLSTTVIDSWLSATLVEIIGIVYVVTNYLFPRRDVPSDGKSATPPL